MRACRPPCSRSYRQLAPEDRDELRETEYARLDANGDVYLDYTGGSLYAESQIVEHMQVLREGVFGNPHSANPTSSAATELVEQAREAVLRYFNAPEGEYECIFTPNATGALRLVGEAYPFAPGGRFLATADKYDRDCVGRPGDGECLRWADREDHVHTVFDQFSSNLRKALLPAFTIARHNEEVLAFDVAEIAKSLAESFYVGIRRQARPQDTYLRDLPRLLCLS